MTVIKDQHNKRTGTDSKDEIVIDKVDCLQRDFASFKPFLIQHIDEKIRENIDRAIDRVLKEKRRPVEVGYR